MAKNNQKNNQNEDAKKQKRTPSDQKEKKSLLKDVKKEANKVESRKQELNQRISEEQQEVERVRERLIKNLFSLLKDVGVDPSNREDINSFLTSLSIKNPDLLELFETAFIGLLEGKTAYVPGEEESQEGQEAGGVGLEKQEVPDFSSLFGLQGQESNAQPVGSGAPAEVMDNPARRAAQTRDGENSPKNFRTLRESALKE